MELTTLEMMNKLKSEQIAKMSDNLATYVVRKSNQFHYCDEKGNINYESGHNGLVIVNEWFMVSKWKILPQYVTFEEVMEAFQEGKKVWVHNDNDDKKDWFSCILDWENREASPSFYEMFRCKWTIED